jgi:hypothetical protein
MPGILENEKCARAFYRPSYQMVDKEPAAKELDGKAVRVAYLLVCDDKN